MRRVFELGRLQTCTGIWRLLKNTVTCLVGVLIYEPLAVCPNFVAYRCSSLKSRHIQFIALGGTIGTGLFLGIGRAFTQAGPLSLLLGYSFTGVAIYAMVCFSSGSKPLPWTNM